MLSSHTHRNTRLTWPHIYIDMCYLDIIRHSYHRILYKAHYHAISLSISLCIISCACTCTCTCYMHVHMFTAHSLHTCTHVFQPENILLDDQNNVKVSDFGFSVILQPGETLSGTHSIRHIVVCKDLLRGRGAQGFPTPPP